MMVSTDFHNLDFQVKLNLIFERLGNSMAVLDNLSNAVSGVLAAVADVKNVLDVLRANQADPAVDVAIQDASDKLVAATAELNSAVHPATETV